LVPGIQTIEVSLILDGSVCTNTVRSVASLWGRLHQAAIPRINYGLVKLGQFVVAEPSLVGVPPNRVAITSALLAGHANTLRNRGRRGRRRSGGWGTLRSIIDSAFGTGTSETRNLIGADGALLRASLWVFFTLVNIGTKESVATVALVTSALVTRSLVDTGGFGGTLLPEEAKGVLGVSALIDVSAA
jgi:hypothetical protein